MSAMMTIQAKKTKMMIVVKIPKMKSHKLASRRAVGTTDSPSLLYRSDRKNNIEHKNNHFG